ncbi:GNAT family N-acetyltransferase [Colwelliaceae bacterium BS250]
MALITTERLSIRTIATDDAPFILELVNEPEFIKNIADKNIHSIDDAINYIKTGPQQMYLEHGFALHVVQNKETDDRVGFCGLLKRDFLPAPDIGFAFLQRHCGKGYAYEAAKAVLDHELNAHQLTKVMAITALDNPASQALLVKLGFVFQQQLHIDGYDGDSNVYIYNR